MTAAVYWQVRRGPQVLAYGCKETLPDEPRRRQLRKHGYKIYVEGKLFRQ